MTDSMELDSKYLLHTFLRSKMYAPYVLRSKNVRIGSCLLFLLNIQIPLILL